jgi:hypothetical protein
VKTKAILSAGALLAAAVALAGCGGAGAGGNASGTTGGVAGAHHAQGAGNFRASVHGFEARLQTSVQAFQNGNLAKAIASGGPLLNNCISVVDTRIAPQASASSHAQTQAMSHLRSACAAMTQAANAGASGNTAKAKQFAGEALQQAKIAARLAG